MVTVFEYETFAFGGQPVSTSAASVVAVSVLVVIVEPFDLLISFAVVVP